MMDPSETNNFENQWKKAFNEASETPPPSAWEGIEARLDHDENNRIIPLWWHSPKLWYAAASVAALLVIGVGLWYNSHSGLSLNENIGVATEMHSENPNEENGASKKEKEVKKVDEKVINDSDGGDRNIASSGIKKDDSLGDKAGNKKNTLKASAPKSDQYVVKSNAERRNFPGTNELATGGGQDVRIAKGDRIADKANLKESEQFSESDLTDTKKALEFSKEALTKNVASSQMRSEMDKETIAASNVSVHVDLLTPLPYKVHDVFMQKRYVFFKPETEREDELTPVKKPKEYWAGIGLMPGSFNPDVQIKEAPNAFVGQLASRQKSLTGTNEAGTSYAVQTQGGLRFSKHWSVELGLAYLQGNAKYQGGGYVLNAYNNASANVLQDALSNLSTSKNPTHFSPSNGPGLAYNSTLFIDVNKKVSNDYQYLQLPVQAGFTLMPDKKLSYSLLGGMMANFFLSNELESAAGEIITTTASDDIYRNMNWAATTGLRFNYKLSTKWKASLTGSYQIAISSGFKANQSLESHPSLYGVSWGVRYSF